MDKKSIKPKKYLGQNFLKDKHVVNKVILAAELKEQDTVLEIGPGLGALTKEISLRVKKLIAIERDRELVEVLKKNLKTFPNIEIIQADILKYTPAVGGPNTKYKVVSNLPYAIVGPVLRKFLEAEYKPELMVLMTQKEVAQRICAKPPKMNLLAVSVQFYAIPKIIGYVPRQAFWPQPHVDSAIIKIVPHTDQQKTVDTDHFFKVVKAGFSQPRKQLVNNLGKGLGIEREETTSWLSKVNIDPKQRAQTLSIQDWENLTIEMPTLLSL